MRDAGQVAVGFLGWLPLLDWGPRERSMDHGERPATGDLTSLLRTWNAGDEAAFDQLMPLVYDELHRIALRCLAGERTGISMQATALVNEACLRLIGWEGGRDRKSTRLTSSHTAQSRMP